MILKSTEESGERSVAVRVELHGRVQGVGFRAWMVRQARRLGLKGWVRNRRDGSVEALLDGPRERIAEMLALCRQGPPLARVDSVRTESVAEPVPDDFEERPTV
ncbi:MAG: acylphosphatase [Geminicoccaceae bacterium]|nr:acylphosphatase [Geminicoccaceae bacterium]MCS7269152.1 acylphosphatase [Geminicoccaceae bacterium]MDW8125298.1 acylphosphatase [Geminicoccaceae bacterium]MDW8342459.1 acylphosphatase [Geminicoccaceae bacterium]